LKVKDGSWHFQWFSDLIIESLLRMDISEMSNLNTIVGHIALNWLSQSPEMIILGITSKGVFLKLSNDKIIFLTNMPDYGPINISTESEIPNRWIIHDSIQVDLSEQTISFLNEHARLDLSPFQIWEIPDPPKYSISLAEQNHRLQKAARQIRMIKGQEGFSLFLNMLNGESPMDLSLQLSEIWEHILQIRSAFLAQDEIQILKHANPIIGYGRGLTPSGDDFFCGLLFTLNRVIVEEKYLNFIQSVNKQILTIAEEKTNSISQSLLYSATLGSADVRVQNAVDVLTDSSIDFKDQAIQMTRYGHSSGADLFVGISIAIQIIQERMEAK
jgi:hypothetical protein